MAEPLPGRPITTPYGARGKYWSCNKNANGGVHTGADWAAPAGTEIKAPIDGQIRRRNYGRAFGNHQFAISPDPGQPFAKGEVFFAHTSTWLKDGQYVKTGDLIAHVGSEGNVTGPHLHMEYHPNSKSKWSCSVHANPQPIIDAESGKKPPKGVLYKVNTKAGLHARRSPNGPNALNKKGKKIVRPNGFKIRVVNVKKVGNTSWSKGSGGLWYASRYLKKV